MWYSATEIGIPEIDMDHHNLDAMLKLCFSGQVPESSLENIVAGLIKHFDHEESIIAELGQVFPADHREEHQRLATAVAGMLADWREGRLSGRELAETLRLRLVLHVAEYDVRLRPPAD